MLLFFRAGQCLLQQLSRADEQVVPPGDVAKASSWPHVPAQGCNGPASLQHAAELLTMLAHQVHLEMENEMGEEAR